MKAWVALIILLFVASSVDARGYRQMHRDRFVIAVVHDGNGTTGQEYTFRFYGYDGRPLYGAEPRVYLNGDIVAKGDTGIDGVFSFTPVFPGLYTFKVTQGMYVNVAGQFLIQKALDYERPTKTTLGKWVHTWDTGTSGSGVY